MINKTEALRLADWIDSDFDPYEMHEVGYDAIAKELRRLHEENERLRNLAATCYAGLGAECDLPENWLDALNNAASGEPFETEALLPFVSPMRAELIQQANRGATAEQQVTAMTQRLEMANALNTEARNQLARQSLEASPTAVQWKVGDEFLPYHLDASHVDPAYRDGWNHCYQAAQLSQAQVVPDGWKLVPGLPTQDMCEAAKYTVHAGLSVFKWADGYKTMLASSPTPPARKPSELDQIRQAIRDYYFALDTRQHGGEEQRKAFDVIEEALGMHWVQGKEAESRKKGATHD